jgi:hypothetical protein
MSVNYAYNYAEIDDATGMCIGFISTTSPDMAGPTSEGTTFVEVPVNDPEYCFKFYINGNWYEDPEGTIPWTSSML